MTLEELQKRANGCLEKWERNLPILDDDEIIDAHQVLRDLVNMPIPEPPDDSARMTDD